MLLRDPFVWLFECWLLACWPLLCVVRSPPGLAGHDPDVALGDVGEEALVASPVVSEEHRDQDGDGEDEQQREVNTIEQLGGRDASRARGAGARQGGVIGRPLTWRHKNYEVWEESQFL